MTAKPEHFSDSVQLEWLHDGKVFMHTMTDSKRHSVDEYIESNLNLIRNWDNNRPFLAIQNISADGVTLTPYLRGRVGEIAIALRERQLTGYSAIILPNNIMMRVFSFFGRIVASGAGPFFEQQYFMSLEAGQEWIEQKLNELYAVAE